MAHRLLLLNEINARLPRTERSVTMIDLIEDTPLSLSAAARCLPAVDGKKPHTSTLWRWCRRGIHGIRLEYAKIGGRIVTSPKALNEFAAALAAADITPFDTPSVSPPPIRARCEAQRSGDIEHARRDLASAGI